MNTLRKIIYILCILLIFSVTSIFKYSPQNSVIKYGLPYWQSIRRDFVCAFRYYLGKENILNWMIGIIWARGSLVIEALCYKSEGRGNESRWGQWFFSIYLILLAGLGPRIYWTTNRQEYQKQKKYCFWRVEHGRPAHKADNLTAICKLIVYIMWYSWCLKSL
jgi:hypothetical protein